MNFSAFSPRLRDALRWFPQAVRCKVFPKPVKSLDPNSLRAFPWWQKTGQGCFWWLVDAVFEDMEYFKILQLYSLIRDHIHGSWHLDYLVMPKFSELPDNLIAGITIAWSSASTLLQSKWSAKSFLKIAMASNFYKKVCLKNSLFFCLSQWHRWSPMQLPNARQCLKWEMVEGLKPFEKHGVSCLKMYIYIHIWTYIHIYIYTYIESW